MMRMMRMHILSKFSTVVLACYASTALAASLPTHSNSPSLALDTHHSPPASAALDTLNLTTTTSHTTPWPQPPWTYPLPGPSPHHLLFDEIAPADTGLEGQQATLHACDEIVRWLWATYTPNEPVDRACVQTSVFAGEKDGKVVVVFVPITPEAVGGKGGAVIGRELALDGVRALEALVWRYGGRSLECEIWAGGELKGRISVEVKVVVGRVGGSVGGSV